MKDNQRSRGYTFTLHNFKERDMEDMYNLINDTNPSYSIFGIEGVHDASTKNPHIHLYVHYANARSFNSMAKHFRKKHHYEAVADPAAMITYCKGYKNGKLKEPLCGENEWYASGIPVANGVCTSSQLVINAIKEGKTIDEIQEIFPSYCLHHYNKLEDLFQRTKTFDSTPVEIIHLKGANDYEYIEDLDCDIINNYNELPYCKNDIIVLLVDAFEQYVESHEFLLSIGRPIRIKVGYKYVLCKPKVLYLWEHYKDPSIKKSDFTIVNGVQEV